MQRSSTSFLKQSHMGARTVVMPSLMLSSASHVEGPYQNTELHQFCGWPNIPVQTSLLRNGEQIHARSDHSYGPARKKRLTSGQKNALDCSFAIDNKLEPERKKKLALELGLTPRQVAIWYQNQRARTKSKHLEEKYEDLNMRYQDVLKERKKLEAEVTKLREELVGFKEKVDLGAKGDKLEKMQNGNSILSTNNQDTSFSTTEAGQQKQQLHVQGKSNQPEHSENTSSESAYNRATFNTSSPASNCQFNQVNSFINKQAFQPQGMSLYAPQKETCTPNHQAFAHTLDTHLYQRHQQTELFQHQYQLSCFRNIVGDVKLANVEYLALPSASFAHFDGTHFLDDYRFKLEDEAAQYLELASQA